MRQFIIFSTILILLAACNSNQTNVEKETEFNHQRLSRIDSMLNKHIANNELPGATVLLYKNNKIVYHKSFGYSKIEQNEKMQNDNIYGIASMTKLVTSVAALILYEKGYFCLNDKLSDYLPEFNEAKVFIEINGEKQIRKAENNILIKDLFRHTSGIRYGSDEYSAAGVDLNKVNTLHEFVQKLSSVPLYSEPGTQFQYSYSTDVLGYLIERLSGQSLREFMIENIFKPLGMSDTDFILSEDKKDRMVSYYSFTNDSLVLLESGNNSIYLDKRTVFSGGGGLISTTSDYANFLKMILDYGKYNGKTILSRKTIELLSSDFLKAVPDKGFLSNGGGHGLGVGLIPKINEYGELGSDGTIFWSGIRNTHFWVDFEEQMYGIIMTQVSPFLYLPYMEEFRILTYQALQ